MNIDFFMNKAIDQAKLALLRDEVPVGAVLVDNKSKEIILSSHNLVNSLSHSLAHAEMLIINKALRERKKKFLKNTTLFITLEPCAMCTAAISEAQIDSIYFGAYDDKKGSIESVMKVYNQKHYFIPNIYGGINEQICSSLIKNFFKSKRKL